MNDISAVGRLPLGGLTGVVAFQCDGKPTCLADSPISFVNHAVPAYFNTLRCPILAGREFSSTDGLKHPLAVIVNDAFARKCLPISPNDSALGLAWPLREIIGVVRNVSRERVWSRVKVNCRRHKHRDGGLINL